MTRSSWISRRTPRRSCGPPKKRMPGRNTLASRAIRGSMPTFTPPTSTTPAWSGCTGPGAEGETCRNLGHETLNGHDTVKYELSCYGEVCRLWIDRKLRVLVERESKWNSTELRNIWEGPHCPACSTFLPATATLPSAASSGPPNHSEHKARP